jgi:hypothetical protein
MAELALEEITMPETEEEIENVMGHYRYIGLPGCIRSIDCVHVFWNKCPAGLLNSCQVGSKAKPGLSFKFALSHTGKNYHSHNSFTAAQMTKQFAKSTKQFN